MRRLDSIGRATELDLAPRDIARAAPGLARALVTLVAIVGAACSGDAPRSAASIGYDCFASVTTATTYTMGDSITVAWDCAPGNNLDWVMVTRAGANCDGHVWYYTGGAITGSHTFVGSYQAGTWVARLYSNNSCTMVAESAEFAITPGSPSVNSNASSYVLTAGLTSYAIAKLTS